MPHFDSLLQIIAYHDKFPYEFDPKNPDEIHHTVPFRFKHHIIGRILPSVVEALREYNDAQQPQRPFHIVEGVYVSFAEWADSFDTRSRIMQELLTTWRKQGLFPTLSGWRDELFPVFGDASRNDNVAFVIERAGTPLFGISAFGAHLNAFIRDPRDGSIRMWVAQRSMKKQTWPGMLDNCVAGGVTYQYSTKETIVRECEEEASIPATLAQQARNVGALSYFTFTDKGLFPETQYVFDLELPHDVVPTPQDGEVERFYLWSLDEVKKTLLEGKWKPNCALVVIDFMMRHAIITADDEPDYIDLSYRLHRQLEFPVPRRNQVC